MVTTMLKETGHKAATDACVSAIVGNRQVPQLDLVAALGLTNKRTADRATNFGDKHDLRSWKPELLSDVARQIERAPEDLPEQLICCLEVRGIAAQFDLNTLAFHTCSLPPVGDGGKVLCG